MLVCFVLAQIAKLVCDKISHLLVSSFFTLVSEIHCNSRLVLLYLAVY